MRRSPRLALRGLATAALALAALSFPTKAQAGQPGSGEPDTLEAEPFDPSIFGGAPSATCGWPTTVQVNGGCTGTLVHPDIVITAAHCLNNGQGASIGFGPNANSLTRNSTCYTHPSYNGSATNDFAYCELSQPVTNVPLIPPLMGCEVDQYIVPGQEVTIVGFGQTNQGVFGVKYEVTTTITNYQNGEVYIGGNGLDSCQGDSGGPVYVQLDDGSWRVFGITSYGGACGGGGVYGNMAVSMQWFEQQTGIDISPCHDAQGSWTPNPDCGQFPMNPAPGSGTDWSQGCAGGSGAELSGFSATCGSPFSPEGDDQAPGVTITAPTDGSTYMTGGEGTVSVNITANAGDGQGFGVEKVKLRVNGEDVPNTDDNTEPYEWELVFPAGSWSIQAIANDFSQNEGVSNIVTIGVDQEPEPGDTGDDTDSGSDSDSDSAGSDSDGSDSSSDSGEDSGTDSDTDTDGGGTTGWVPGQESGGPGIDDDSGCNCSASPADDGRAPFGVLFVFLGLLGVTRGRRRG